MKKFYTLAFVMLAALGMSAQDSVSVVLAVDMNNETVSADGVTIAGNFQAAYAGTACGDWSPGCTPLTDDDADGVYTVKLKLPAGSYQFKFINGIAWGDDEGSGLTADCGVDNGVGGFNREMDLTNDPTDVDTVVGAYVYNSCDVSSIMVTSIERGFDDALAMTVAPNPAFGTATLSFANDRGEDFNMTVTTMTGAVVRSEVVAGTSVEITRNDLPAGLYFVTLTNAEGQRATRKMIFR